MLGTPVSMPVLVAPMAFQQLAHEEHELATARGTAAARTLMCLSTVATATPTQVAEAAPEGERWLQIYVFRDREVSDAVIEEALAVGFSALVLTADLPVYGIRHRESRAGFVLPDDTAPAIAAARARGGEGTAGLGMIESGLGIAAGCVVASLEALPEVVEAVDGRAEVYLDGGVRRGTDVVTALALGARAVLVGRPVMYGLAFGGAKGVEQVLGILREETENALALLGCRSPDDVSRAHVSTAFPT